MTTLIPKFDLKNGGATPANAINRTIYEKLSDSVSVKDFGAIGDGTTDDTVAIQAAINASNTVFVPVGTYKITSTITLPNGVTLYGFNRLSTSIIYYGSGNAFYNSNPINSSGAGSVTLRGLTITSNGTSTGAAVNFAAHGFAFYEITDCRLAGDFKYNLIIDGCEVSNFNNNIFELVGSGNACVWIVNGPENTAGQVQGYTNVITISNNQFNSSTPLLLIDDGGSDHIITNNNFNGGSQAATFCGVQSLTFTGNSCETTSQTGNYNVQFNNVSQISGATKGPCTNGVIQGNTFSGNMSTSGPGATLIFLGDYHTGFNITGNYFGSVFGRGAAISITYLGSSFCGFNYDAGTSSVAHYSNVFTNIGVHGNTIYPPQYGSPVLGQGSFAFQRTDLPVTFEGGVTIQNVVILTGNAAPTTGSWFRSNIVINTAPVAGGYIGWVCTNSGTPGTWNTWGAITP